VILYVTLVVSVLEKGFMVWRDFGDAVGEIRLISSRFIWKHAEANSYSTRVKQLQPVLVLNSPKFDSTQLNSQVIASFRTREPCLCMGHNLPFRQAFQSQVSIPQLAERGRKLSAQFLLH
jgi:hypothetical protein